jgi:endonuclease-3
MGSKSASKFHQLISVLEKHYGKPKGPPARGPFELVLWENACYLMPDERRAEVFGALRDRVGLNARAILDADKSVLMPLAQRGGMQPERLVFRWKEIARITLDQFGGDLDCVLSLPCTEALRALRLFPNVGGPGAEKILMWCGKCEGLPLESNGVRVLTRVGFGRSLKSYGASYKSVQEALAGETIRDFAAAHMLLREHGKTLCKTNGPLCEVCPAARLCLFDQRG